MGNCLPHYYQGSGADHPHILRSERSDHVVIHVRFHHQHVDIAAFRHHKARHAGDFVGGQRHDGLAALADHRFLELAVGKVEPGQPHAGIHRATADKRLIENNPLDLTGRRRAHRTAGGALELPPGNDHFAKGMAQQLGGYRRGVGDHRDRQFRWQGLRQREVGGAGIDKNTAAGFDQRCRFLRDRDFFCVIFLLTANKIARIGQLQHCATVDLFAKSLFAKLM